MTAKEYLCRARKIQARLDALERAKSGAWERATAVTPNRGVSVQGGDISRKAESYAVLTEKIEREQDRLYKLQAEIIGTITQVHDNTLAALLMSYYINGNTWEETAVVIHYSYNHTIQIKHPQALRAVEKILNDKRPCEIL